MIIFLRYFGMFVAFLGAVGLSIGLFFTWGSSSSTRYLPLIGLAPIGFGSFLMLTPRLFAKRLQGGLYAVTDRRCLVWFREGIAGGYVIRTYHAEDLGNMYRRERSDGVGDLIFQAQAVALPSDNGSAIQSTREYGFYAIPDVAEVERLVRDTFGLH